MMTFIVGWVLGLFTPKIVRLVKRLLDSEPKPPISKFQNLPKTMDRGQ